MPDKGHAGLRYHRLCESHPRRPQRLGPRVYFRGLLPAQPLKVVARLRGEPQFRAVAAELVEPQRHLGCYGCALTQDGMKSLPRDSQKMGNLGSRAPERRSAAPISCRLQS